jgi:molybdenum cofactor synthesis domain-containing protein
MRRPESQATILTVGDEIASGDVENTNGTWLAQQLAALGVGVRLLAAIPDDVDEIARFVRDEARRCEYLLVTGGLGGTPDDVTRAGVAAAFGAELAERPDIAAQLAGTLPRLSSDYLARFAVLPAGADPLPNPLGGAPGFVLRNVYVFPGVPAEMRATFGTVAEAFRRNPILAVRLSFETDEAGIVRALEDATQAHPAVAIGSYPSHDGDRRHVDVVLKSADETALRTAVDHVSAAIEEALAIR